MTMSTPARAYKGSMQSDGKNDALLPLKPVRECISCHKEYDRKATNLFKPLGVFENYCLCEECLHKDQHGWGGKH
jgi:hypothetical protein